MFSERFASALLYANNLHKNQERKSTGAPYIGHLLGVAATVIEYTGDENEAIAALLHDSIEDQGGKETLAQIGRLFGETVAKIVEGCSDTDEMPKPPWKERKEKHVAHMLTADEPTIFVVAADKLYNLRMLVDDYRYDGEEAFKFYKGGKEGTLWYYRAMSDAMRKGHASIAIRRFAVSRVLNELEDTVDVIERMAAERKWAEEE